MKIVYLVGFPEEERRNYKDVLLHNTLIGLETTLIQAEKTDIGIQGEVLKYGRLLKQVFLIENNLIF